MKFVASTLLAFSLALFLSAQQQANTTFPRFTMAHGDLDSDGLPTSGAKLCLLPEKKVCYKMPSKPIPQGTATYDFGLDPQAERLQLAGGGSWVFFASTFSGGGSGTLTRLAVLRLTKDGEIENLLSDAAVTDVSDRAMWNLPNVSKYPVLVDADFIWGKDEAHFDRHFFNVQGYVFDEKSSQYAKAFSYKTSKRYDSGDAGPVLVLGSEKPEILRKLAQVHP